MFYVKLLLRILYLLQLLLIIYTFQTIKTICSKNDLCASTFLNKS